MPKRVRQLKCIDPQEWNKPKKRYRAKQCMVCAKDIPNKKGSQRRFRLCRSHLACDFNVGGHVVRYCQQCANFHPIEEFNKNNSTCISRMQRRKKLYQNNKSSFKTNEPIQQTLNTYQSITDDHNVIKYSAMQPETQSPLFVEQPLTKSVSGDDAKGFSKIGQQILTPDCNQINIAYCEQPIIVEHQLQGQFVSSGQFYNQYHHDAIPTSIGFNTRICETEVECTKHQSMLNGYYGYLNGIEYQARNLYIDEIPSPTQHVHVWQPPENVPNLQMSVPYQTINQAYL